MTLENSLPRQPAPHPKRSRGTFASLLAVSLAVASLLCLLAVILLSATERRRITAEIQRVTERHRQLQTHLDRLDHAAEAARHDREVILSVLGQCRSVEDLPPFQAARIATRRLGIANTFFYVPAGTHRLEVQVAWQPGLAKTIDRAAPPSPVKTDEGLRGEQTYSIPLLPESGYHFQINRGYKPGPVSWTLTSNHPKFETKLGQLPLSAFRGRGYSSSGSQGIVVMPQPLDLRATATRKQPILASPGLTLHEFTLRGTLGNQPYKVPWTIRLISEVPPSVSAEEAAHLLARGYPQTNLVYQGKGRYGFRDHRVAEPKP
jgi:hypothetical protein